MKLTVFYCLGPVFLLGCSGKPDNAAPLEETVAPAPQQATIDAASLSGQEAYEMACARCHDTGVDGAPVTRNPADWENRSHLWQAVLMEHARDGYLDMPAKGGDTNLPDMTVSAAAEYMLEITFPNLPAD